MDVPNWRFSSNRLVHCDHALDGLWGSHSGADVEMGFLRILLTQCWIAKHQLDRQLVDV